eukprot:scaffold27294_cov80-Skeletonema_marinoi.AAC.2
MPHLPAGTQQVQGGIEHCNSQLKNASQKWMPGEWHEILDICKHGKQGDNTNFNHQCCRRRHPYQYHTAFIAGKQSGHFGRHGWLQLPTRSYSVDEARVTSHFIHADSALERSGAYLLLL